MEQIHFKTDEYTLNKKERKGHWLDVSPHVGDKLTYFIYCPDTNHIVSRSNICSADPFRVGIVNKRLDPDVSSANNDSDMLLPPLSDSWEIIKEHQDNNDALALANQNSGEHKDNQDNQDSGEHKASRENMKGKKPGKKKIRYLIKGITRDRYNEKVVGILRNKANIQTQQRQKKASKNKGNPRRLARTYGKHDKVSTRSSARIKQVSAEEKKTTVHENLKQGNDQTAVHENLKLKDTPDNPKIPKIQSKLPKNKVKQVNQLKLCTILIIWGRC